MKFKTTLFIVLSTLLHGIFILVLVNSYPPNPKQEVKHQPIKSYIYVEKSRPVSKPISIPANKVVEVIAQVDNNTELSTQPNIRNETQLKAAANYSLQEEKTTPSNATPSVSSRKTQTVVSQYIQNLHSHELKQISKRALNEFKKPKPLIDKSIPLTTNQRLKALSTPFAPKGSDIIVLSEFGPDETTIILGDSCFTITQTALDDQVWKGAALWTKSNSCGKYDKFDGQLQRSLNKYLQK